LQGLSRYRDDVGVESDYIVVELASNRLGEKWQTEFLDKVNRGLSFPRWRVGTRTTFRATGKGWQSRMDEVLREYVASQVH
jgi:hypothetical protein